jgi:hypothetical protein
MTATPHARTLALLFLLAATAAVHGQIKPTIIGTLMAGDTSLQGIGDPAAGTQVFICVSPTAPTNPPADCSLLGANPPAATFTGAPAPPTVTINPDTQIFSVTLAAPLTANSFVYLVQKAGGAALFSQVVSVGSLGTNNEREQTDFVGGTLLSANGANYSQASLFLALNYDRTIWRSGWYSHQDMACVTSGGFPVRPTTPPSPATPLVLCPRTRHPGLNTFFQARLTTIPVNASTTTMTATAGTTTPTPATSVSSFLAAQKSAQFGGGIYLPVLFGKVPSNKQKNATFYVAPIARFGFSTPTSSPSGSNSTTTSGGTTTTTTTTDLGTPTTANGQLYNYGLVGMRIATADLNPGTIHTTHYFDVGIGKYSNLQSLVCKGAITTCQTTIPATGTTPATTFVDPTKENRSTLLRLEFEGFLEIISAKNSSLILGINANTGPGFIAHRTNLDTNNRAAEDIEFLIGYKFDVSQLLGGISIIGKN